MEKPTEKILRRIKHLLAMAADTSSPNEAGIAAQRAQKLMAQYNLENIESILTDLEDDASIEQDSVTDFRIAEGRAAKTIPDWVGILAVAVGRLFDCECKATRTQTGATAITFYGYKTDLAVCRWTFEYLIAQIRTFSRRAREEHPNDKAWTNDYRRGLVNGIMQVINEAKEAKRKADTESAAGTSLVVVKQDAIAKKFGNFKYQNVNTGNVNAAAYYRGKEDGKSVRLNQPLPGGSSKPKLLS